MVYIKCPQTGYLVSTNHIVHDEEKLALPTQRHLEIHCPYCNNIHIWNDKNGFFLSPSDKGN